MQWKNYILTPFRGGGGMGWCCKLWCSFETFQTKFSPKYGKNWKYLVNCVLFFSAKWHKIAWGNASNCWGNEAICWGNAVNCWENAVFFWVNEAILMGKWRKLLGKWSKICWGDAQKVNCSTPNKMLRGGLCPAYSCSGKKQWKHSNGKIHCFYIVESAP